MSEAEALGEELVSVSLALADGDAVDEEVLSLGVADGVGVALAEGVDVSLGEDDGLGELGAVAECEPPDDGVTAG